MLNLSAKFINRISLHQSLDSDIRYISLIGSLAYKKLSLIKNAFLEDISTLNKDIVLS